MARLAAAEAVRGTPHELVASAFAEWDVRRGTAVREAWRRREARSGGALPYQYLARDVWDLLREDGPSDEEGIPGRGVQRRRSGGGRQKGGEGLNPLQRYADSLPEGTLVLVVAGSPCQQLAHGGRLRGRQGLCGRQPVHFYAALVVAWFLAELGRT